MRQIFNSTNREKIAKIFLSEPITSDYDYTSYLLKTINYIWYELAIIILKSKRKYNIDNIILILIKRLIDKRSKFKSSLIKLIKLLLTDQRITLDSNFSEAYNLLIKYKNAPPELVKMFLSFKKYFN